MRRISLSGYLSVCFVALTFCLGACSTFDHTQKTFSTPDEAAQTLLHAAETDDSSALLALFGPGSNELVNSGDPVQDKNRRAQFVASAKRSMKVRPDERNRSRFLLLIGSDGYPFPVPLVETNSRWRFETEQGKIEILARRIGLNEIDAIAACDEYVKAQYEYSAVDHSGAGVPEYARKLISSPGKQDGLYWPEAPGSAPSPASTRVAQMKAEGYAKNGDAPVPYHGYYFKTVNAQGADAPGGARDYMERDLMIGGFGLIAWPAEYRSSGIKTFIVNQDGVVYGKDLGLGTAAAVAEIVTFNPDKSWIPEMPDPDLDTAPSAPAVP